MPIPTTTIDPTKIENSTLINKKSNLEYNKMETSEQKFRIRTPANSGRLENLPLAVRYSSSQICYDNWQSIVNRIIFIISSTNLSAKNFNLFKEFSKECW